MTHAVRWMMFLLSVPIAIMTGCGTAKDESVPRELMGRWVTSAPGYEVCYTEITETTIDFYTVERTLRQYRIERVERVVKEKDDMSHDVLDIHYKDLDDDDYLLSVVLIKEEEHHRLQFFNQPHLVWTKDG